MVEWKAMLVKSNRDDDAFCSLKRFRYVGPVFWRREREGATRDVGFQIYAGRRAIAPQYMPPVPVLGKKNI